MTVCMARWGRKLRAVGCPLQSSMQLLVAVAASLCHSKALNDIDMFAYTFTWKIEAIFYRTACIHAEPYQLIRTANKHITLQ